VEETLVFLIKVVAVEALEDFMTLLNLDGKTFICPVDLCQLLSAVVAQQMLTVHTLLLQI
jgi:hypothetical protein